MKTLFISLGCDKNLVESEAMIGALSRAGHVIVQDETEAELIIVNTCCFVHDAKEESINTILEMAEYKQTGNLKALVVCGCLAQRYQEEITKEIPEVDAVLGTASFDELLSVVEKVEKGEKPFVMKELSHLPATNTGRLLTTGGHYAHLKIADGCDKHCTYCIIPKIRGTYRSVPMEDVLEEARYLANQGVKELILVAQETTIYGQDLYGEKKLPELLDKLCEIPGIYWIRILYCYPEEITEELVAVMKRQPKICHYLDIPVQHASDAILKAMGRRTTRQELVEKIEMLRREIPDIALRTTLITGFPGESEEDHESLMQFVDEMEFDRLGVFTYSPEEGTAAAKLGNQISEEVKEDRQAELMELQQEIAFDKAEEKKDHVYTVMIEGSVADENVYVGRTYMDAPGIDGLIFVQSDENFVSGDFVKVRVTGAYEYDLIGEVER